MPGVGVAEAPLVDQRRAVGGLGVGDPLDHVEVEALQLGGGVGLGAVRRPEDPGHHQLHLVVGDLLGRERRVEGEDPGGHLLGRVADRAPALADQFQPEGEDVLE